MDTKVISSGVQYTSLPKSYIRPESERPRLLEVSDCEDVPVINLGCEDRPSLVRQIREACENYGFFQVTNHGVRLEAVESMLKVANEFFNMPVEEKLKLYSDDPAKTMRLSTSFNVNKEKVHNWRDYLRLHCYPLDKYVPEWPSNPPQFKRHTCSTSVSYSLAFALSHRSTVNATNHLHSSRFALSSSGNRFCTVQNVKYLESKLEARATIEVKESRVAELEACFKLHWRQGLQSR